MKIYKKILAMLLALIMIFAVCVISVSADGEDLPIRLDFSVNDIWNCDDIEFDTNYIAPIPDGSSDKEAYIADIQTYDDVDYYYKLTAKNLNLPTDNGLAYVQIVEFFSTEEPHVLAVAEGEEKSIIFRLQPFKRYIVRFFNEDSSPSDGGDLAFNITRIPDPEPDGYTKKWIEKGEHHNGSITVPEDKDWIAFSVEESGDYRIVLAKRNDTDATFLADLYTFEGEYITSATLDEGRNLSMYFTQETDDFSHYVIRLSCPEGQSGDYTVVFNDAKIIRNFSMHGSGWLTLNGCGNDLDVNYVKFTTLDQEAHYRFWASSDDINTNPASEDEQVQVELLNENFEFMEKLMTFEKGKKTYAYRALEESTTYYLKIYNGNPEDTQGGEIYLNIDYDLDEDKGLMEYATEIKIGETVSGELINGFDRDWFKFTTDENTRYVAVLDNKNAYETNSSGVPKLIRAEVYNENGENVYSFFARGEEKHFERIDLEPDSTYYIKVFDTEHTTGKYDILIAERLISGDTDLNDKVKIQDTTLIQKAVAKIINLEGKQLITADVTQDGTVNIKDATAIQKYIAKVKTPYNVGGYII